MPIMNIGRMDREIVIETPTFSQSDEYGEPTTTWATWNTVWANVYTGGGREFEAAQQTNAEIDTQFQIRYVAGLSPKMRISYNSQYYDILRIEEVGRRNRWNIWAKARQE
jgi:SPP1 family predicted phage head-tail adaptor